MEGRNGKCTSSPFKSTPDCTQDNNKNVPRGLMFRELGHKQRLGVVSQEFQAIAEEKLVMKRHEELRCELPGPSRSTFLMVFSPDGTKVASTHGNHNVYVTDLTTGKNVNTLSGHPRTPWCIAFHPSSNQILASGCLGGQVRVWDLHGGSEMWMADGQTVIASLAFHPTDRMLVIATYNELHFWDWSQPEPFTKCYTNNEKEKVRYVAFDPLGHKLITGISNAPQIQSQWDQWDRVPSCNASSSTHSTPHRSSLLAPDRERRITVCYRSLVEQYEQLVQRYFDLSRSRSISTMDRGTDPMDFETEAPTSNVRTRTTSGPSTSSGSSGNTTNSGSRWRERNNNTTTEGGANSSNSSSNNADASGYLHSLFCNPWQRNRPERPANQTDTATTTSETEPATGTNSGTSTPSVFGCQRHRCDSRLYLPPFHNLNSRFAERPASATLLDSLRRRLNTLLDNAVPHTTPSLNRDILIVREDTLLRNHANSTYEPPNERGSNRDRPTSPIFLPSIPRRFFVSQSSAFQPRVPRSDHSSESRNSSRSVPPRRSTQRISLNAATAAAVAAVPERRTPETPDRPRSRSPLSPMASTRSRSDMTDIGVRYGIQLLSRHIDNMQRLCRARLEILQLQQIRRMWEDLQHQIRSLHSAVRESSITLARLAESPLPGPSHLYSSSQTPPNETSQRQGSSRDSTESNSDGNSGHIPSVSQMLELARISDNSPAGSRVISSQNSAEDNLSRVPEEEIFQPPDGSSRLEGEPSERNSLSEPGSSGNAVNDETNNQQYSFRCQMLQQRLWRISRKVYLRRPRLLTVNSRTMRRQLYSSHPPLNRGNSNQSRHADTSRRPWFLHSVARHRSLAKSTHNVSSQVDSSCPPGKIDGKSDNSLSSLAQAKTSSSSREIDDSQPGPSGLCFKSSSSRKPWGEEKVKMPILDDEDDDDDDDDDYDDDEEEEKSNSFSQFAAKVERSKKDNEQQCSLPPAKIRKIDASGSSNAERGNKRCDAKSSTSEEPSDIRRKLLEEIDRLFPTTYSAPPTSSTSSSSAPSTLFTPSKPPAPLNLSAPSNPSTPLDSSTSNPSAPSNPSSPSNLSFPLNLTVPSTLANSSTPSNLSGTLNSSIPSNSSPLLNPSAPLNLSSSLNPASPLNLSSPTNPPAPSNPSAPLYTSAPLYPSAPLYTSAPSYTNPSSFLSAPSNPSTPLNLSTPINPLTPLTPSPLSNLSAQSTPSASSVPASSSDNAEASTSQGTGSRDRSNPQEPSACKSLWSMIARLERLLQQQREQRDRLRNVLSDQGQSRRTNTWSLRDRNIERIENSGSDSDSNTESERPRNWGRMSAEERLSNALQTEMYERERMCRAAAGAQNSRGGQQEEEWEWTRESTRLRARQVLSLMVESLTQFFEENGLSSNTPHAVLDEQIFNLHVLLQLALELTDLLLAQLVCTRRELEHQWVHRLRSPVALAADDHHFRDSDRERDTRSRGRQDEPTHSTRLPPYRRMYRHRLSVDGDGNNRPERTSLCGTRTEYSRRLNSRVMNCLARHNRLSPHSGSAHNASMRPGRSTYGRPITRPLMTRSNPGHIPSHIMTNPRVAVRRLDADSLNNDASSVNDSNVERPHASSNEASSSSSSNIPTSQSHDAFTVPLVRVNDVLIPDTSLLNQPRTRPQSPPLLHPNSPFANPFSQVGASEQRSRNSPWDYWPYVPGSSFRPRFLHPRYMGPGHVFTDDPDDAIPNPDFGYFRANTVPETVFITDAPMTPNHRIQVWDFSKFQIPDISNAEKNVIVPECKIQNDASVDVSKDGRLLVTLLPSGRQSITTMLGVYSLQWESLGQCLYTTSFLQSAVSVSLSPASRYLLVGLASRRVALLPNDRHYMAQVFRLDGGKPGLSVGGRGRLRHMRDIEQIRDQGYMSLNCIRWAPGPGQGFVYGTNNGQLKVLR